MKGNDIKTLTTLLPDPVGVVYNQNNNNKKHEGKCQKNTNNAFT